ncbi:hypothetical protein [Ekhidna sp.]
MKKTHLLLLCFIAICLASCQEDELVLNDREEDKVPDPKDQTGLH